MGTEGSFHELFYRCLRNRGPRSIFSCKVKLGPEYPSPSFQSLCCSLLLLKSDHFTILYYWVVLERCYGSGACKTQVENWDPGSFENCWLKEFDRVAVKAESRYCSKRAHRADFILSWLGKKWGVKDLLVAREICPLILCSGVCVCAHLCAFGVGISVCAWHSRICYRYCNAIIYLWSTWFSFSI